MVKIVNKWFYFNPLFVLYTDDEWFLEEVKNYNTDNPVNNSFYRVSTGVYEDPWDYDVRQMDSRDSPKIESQMVNHPSANRLREQFQKNEEFHDFLGYSLNYDFKKLPVALITFVLSIFIATDFSLRQTFYDLYHGKKIPAITQWCLNTLRVGPISDREWVSDFNFIDDEYQATLFCCGLGNTFADKDSFKEWPERIVAWFDVLDQHFSTDPKPYMESVGFTRVSSVSPKKNYLCGLTVENGAVTSSETCYFHQLSDHEKDIYTMLARVLDCVCVPENTELIIPHKNLLERNFNEEVMTTQLIRFIVSRCKTFLT